MLLKTLHYGFFLLWTSASLAAIPGSTPARQTSGAVSANDIAVWGFGMVFVLGLFFVCVWALRKAGGMNTGTQRMRLLGGLSLGMREKIVLLQAGKKQLILGVTPGRIETLLVLEGEDCLQQEPSFSGVRESGASFAEKMAHLIAKQQPERKH